MELLIGLMIGGAFVVGWVLGYYDMPSIALTHQDAMQDEWENQHVPRSLTVASRKGSNGDN